MAGELTTFASKAILEYVFGKTNYKVIPFTTYLALCVDLIDDDTAVNVLPEVTTAGYARTAITWGAATNVNPPVIANSALVTFPAVTADMAQPIVSAALMTSNLSGQGDYLAWWILDQPLQLNAGQQIQIAPSQLTMSLT